MRECDFHRRVNAKLRALQSMVADTMPVEIHFIVMSDTRPRLE